MGRISLRQTEGKRLLKIYEKAITDEKMLGFLGLTLDEVINARDSLMKKIENDEKLERMNTPFTRGLKREDAELFLTFMVAPDELRKLELHNVTLNGEKIKLYKKPILSKFMTSYKVHTSSLSKLKNCPDINDIDIVVESSLPKTKYKVALTLHTAGKPYIVGEFK